MIVPGLPPVSLTENQKKVATVAAVSVGVLITMLAVRKLQALSNVADQMRIQPHPFPIAAQGLRLDSLDRIKNAAAAHADLFVYKKAGEMIPGVKRLGLDPTDRRVWEMFFNAAAHGESPLNSYGLDFQKRAIEVLTSYKPGQLGHYQNLLNRALARLNGAERLMFDRLMFDRMVANPAW